MKAQLKYLVHALQTLTNTLTVHEDVDISFKTVNKARQHAIINLTLTFGLDLRLTQNITCSHGWGSSTIVS